MKTLIKVLESSAKLCNIFTFIDKLSPKFSSKLFTERENGS